MCQLLYGFGFGKVVGMGWHHAVCIHWENTN